MTKEVSKSEKQPVEKKPVDLGKKAVRENLNAVAEEIDKKKQNHRGRGRTDSEKKEIYRRYEERKNIVFEAEKRNFEHLVLFLASDGEDPKKEKKFYVMGGNSAIIYVGEIASRIGRREVFLKPDHDRTVNIFANGVTKIADIEAFTENMKRLKIERVEKNSSKWIVYYKLPHKYTEEEISKMLKRIKADRKKLNEVVYAKLLFPSVNKQILKLKPLVYHAVIKMERTARETLGDEIMRPVFEMADAYALMTNGCVEKEIALEKIKALVSILGDRVLTMTDLQLWAVSTATRIALTLADLKAALEEVK